ncbi:alternative oxidase [Argonema galeatum]|uniref:alternative oxidase n=1 Tax=Argonema galeatum TaxID=2942762 RepID=UPI002010F2CC|nr:alternative oxidase [Argonema galeatum]MCL1465480.1 plastoquinol terminal oxidase [Argonema galeatum A003/A1]
MIRLLVNFLEFILNYLYRDRLYPRFFVLETVARVPYFAFTSVLHLYETMGWWRKADWLKVHFAESWNELHHLLTMESLGGNKYWIDRFVAHTGAFVYYWILICVYIVAPKSAYQFMQMVEEHAYETYEKFLVEYGEQLKTEPAPQVAINYYLRGDLYLFDEFQTSRPPEERRPKIENLYDVFVAIRDDEMEHVKTMVACQKPDAQVTFKSPHSGDAKFLPESSLMKVEESDDKLAQEAAEKEPAKML